MSRGDCSQEDSPRSAPNAPVRAFTSGFPPESSSLPTNVPKPQGTSPSKRIQMARTRNSVVAELEDEYKTVQETMTSRKMHLASARNSVVGELENDYEAIKQARSQNIEEEREEA